MVSSVVLQVQQGAYATDPAPQSKVNAGNLQTDVVNLYGNCAAILAALNRIQRDDDTLVDALVRSRNLHQEITLAFGVLTGGKLLAACQAASTANVTIANPGTSTFDGVTLVNGNRILLVAQTAGAENGVYVFNGSGVAMTRATDCDSSDEVTAANVPVYHGSTYENTLWVMTTASPILGTTALTWVYLPLARTSVGIMGQRFRGVVTNGTYTVLLYAARTMTLRKLRSKAGAGSCTLAVKINTVAVPGINAAAVTTALATASVTAGSGIVAVGDLIEITVSAAATLSDLVYDIEFAE